jgi:Helix-turn-helix domain
LEEEMATIVVNYEREELYSLEEAAKIIDVSLHTIYQATHHGVFTAVRLPHDRSKYIPKFEVEAAAETKAALSRETKERIEAARKNRVPNENSSSPGVNSEWATNIDNKLNLVLKTLAKIAGDKSNEYSELKSELLEGVL